MRLSYTVGHSCDVWDFVSFEMVASACSFCVCVFFDAEGIARLVREICNGITCVAGFAIFLKELRDSSRLKQL